jgi:hypothetical protein
MLDALASLLRPVLRWSAGADAVRLGMRLLEYLAEELSGNRATPPLSPDGPDRTALRMASWMTAYGSIGVDRIR